MIKNYKMYIQSVQDVYYILTAVSSSIILLLSFLLVRLRLPAVNDFRNFRMARLYLSISYAILGLSGLISYFSSPEYTASVSLFMVTVSVASFQSLLFTVVHLLLMESNFINKKKFRQHVILLVSVNVLVLAVYLSNIISDIAISSAALLLYLILQGYYIVKFNKLCKNKKKFSGIYYDKFQNERLKTLIISFYASFSVGLLSLASSVLGLTTFIVFIVVYTLYYTHMVVILYNKFSPITSLSAIINVQNKDKTESNETVLPINTNINVNTNNTDEELIRNSLKTNLKKWVDDKGFAQCDLSVDEVAELLGTDRNYLRKYFRDVVHTDFRTWRSELRIEEAKKLLIAYPNYSTSQVGEMVGFNHRSNFFTQFTKIAGVTPKDWRKEHGITTD